MLVGGLTLRVNLSNAIPRLVNGQLPQFFPARQCSHAPFFRIRELSRQGDHSGAISLFIQMLRDTPLKPDRPLFFLLLRASASLPSQHLAFSTHAHVVKSGFQEDIIVMTGLIDAFCKCSNTEAARKLFDEMAERDVAAWNAMMSGYLKNGDPDQALSLFRQMSLHAMEPNSLTFSVLLQVCGDIRDKRLGRCVHAYVCRRLGRADTFLLNSLIVHYNQCGDLHLSESLFDTMPARDIVSCNAMMSGYTRNGFALRAMDLFHILREEDVGPDLVTIETAIQACAQIGKDAIFGGEAIHGLLIKMGFPINVYIENSLLHMYCRCGRMETAWFLFDRMENKNGVSLNIIVNGYIQIKDTLKALSTINQSRLVESWMSSDLVVGILQALKLMVPNLLCLMSVHSLVVKMGCESDLFVSSSLIDTYGDNGEVETARSCLDHVIKEKANATACYNSMLSVYSRHGYFSEALELLCLMQHQSCNLDSITLISAVSICARQQKLKLGKAIQGYILRNRIQSDVGILTSLIELYAKCGRWSLACWLFSNMPFRNIVSWNTMIHGCLENGFPRASLKLFFLMQWQDGLVPDATTLVAAIEAISQRGYKSEGNYIHHFAVQSGLVNDEYVANSLIAMHVSFHNFEEANMIFGRAVKDKTIIWNTMMSVYTNHGLLDRAWSFFHLMKLNSVSPDSVTILCLLRICAGLDSLNNTRQVHTSVCKNGFESNVYVGTSLIDVYGKCGDLEGARLIFDNLNSKNTISWNSMIRTYGMHGNVKEVDDLFSQMQQLGFHPTPITFLILLSSCSHAGEAEKCQHYLDLMLQAYSLLPGREHVSSFADFLSRRGLIKAAYELMKEIPVNPGISSWGALLGACRAQNNLEMVVAVAKKVFDTDPLHCGYRVLLSNICMEAGRWIDASTIRREVQSMQLKRVHGWSMVEASPDL